MVDNNEPNFAPEGNIVGIVPTGTGLLIMANDDIEVFGNTITGNISNGIAIASYYINDTQVSKPSYDPVPEKIYIHDNVITNNGTDPQELAAAIAGLVFDVPENVLDIFYDSSGVGTDYGLLVEFPDGFTESQRVCVVNNTPGITVWQGNASAIFLNRPISEYGISSDPENVNCTHASLPEIVLEPPVDPSNPDGPDLLELCDVAGTGLNADAYVADCPKLSDFRLFADPTNPMSGAQGGIIYDLTTPLFTDYANKYRFVFIPEGSQAAYRDQEVFDFPVGTIIAKTFTIQADLRLENSDEELIETRLLIRRQDGWKALPYIWNADKSDAILTRTGGTQLVNWVDMNGVSRSTNYKVPNTNDCANCHGEKNLIPIGPKARLLNKDFAYASGTANQLEHWTTQGILTGVPADTSSIDTIPLWDDTSADLTDRARGYLDINCAHCHQPTIGAANTSGLYLEYYRPFGSETGRCKPPVAAGSGAGNLDYDIVPGNAAESIMDFRMDSIEPGVAMPELGRTIIHTEGVQLIRDWINAMPLVDCKAP